MSVEERVPLSPVKGLRRAVVIPPPPRRSPAPRPASAVAAAQNPSSSATAAEDRRPLTSVDGPPHQPETLPPPPPTIGQDTSGPNRQGRPKASDAAELMRATTLSLPAAVVAALKQRAVTDRVSQAEVLLDALSATATELADLVGSTRPQPTREGLFLRLPARGPAEPMATLSLRMLTRNVEAIDDLVTRTEAPSRSLLCSAALRRYLDL